MKLWILLDFQNAQEVNLIFKVTARLLKVSKDCYMRESRNFRQGGGPGPSDRQKAQTTF